MLHNKCKRRGIVRPLQADTDTKVDTMEVNRLVLKTILFRLATLY